MIELQSPPPQLAALTELFKSHDITAFEFGAAHTYWLMSHAARVTIESRMKGPTERAIIRNLIVKQMAPDHSVYAATASHPAGVIHYVRRALDQLAEALQGTQHP